MRGVVDLAVERVDARSQGPIEFDIHGLILQTGELLPGFVGEGVEGIGVDDFVDRSVTGLTAETLEVPGVAGVRDVNNSAQDGEGVVRTLLLLLEFDILIPERG